MIMSSMLEDFQNKGKQIFFISHSRPLFGDDDNIADTFGEDFGNPKVEKTKKNIKDDLANDDVSISLH